MFWQRSTSVKQHTSKGREQQKKHEPILNLAQNQDYLTDDDSSRLKQKLNNLRGTLTRRDNGEENYQEQLNDLTNILKEMQGKSNYPNPNNTRQNSFSNLPLNRTRPYASEVQMDLRNPIDAQDYHSLLPNDQGKLKQKLISQDIQIETLEQICDLLKHQNKALESQINHLRTLILDKDKMAHMNRQNVLRQALDRVFQANGEIQKMNQDFEKEVANFKNQKMLLEKQNDILKRQIGERRNSDKKYMQPEGKRITELLDLVDDLKETIANTKDQNEKLKLKNNFLQNRKIPLHLKPDDLFDNPQLSAPETARNSNDFNRYTQPDKYQYYGGITDTVPQTTRNRAPDYDEYDDTQGQKGYNGVRDTINEARRASNQRSNNFDNSKTLRSLSRERGANNLVPLSTSQYQSEVEGGIRPRSGSQVIRLQNELDDLQHQNQGLQQRIKNLEDLNDIYSNKQPSNNENQNKSFDNEVQEAQKQNKDLKNQNRRLKYELSQKEQDVMDTNQLTSEVEDLRLQNQELRDKFNTLREEKTNNENDALTQIQGLTEKLQSLEDQYDILDTEADRKQREIREVKSELTRRQIDFQEMQLKVKEMDNQERERRENERRELEKKIEQERQEIERLEQERRENNKIPTRDIRERIHSPHTGDAPPFSSNNNNFYSARRKTNEPYNSPEEQRINSMQTKTESQIADENNQSRQNSLERMSSQGSIQENQLYDDIQQQLRNLEQEVQEQRKGNETLNNDLDHFRLVLTDLYETIRSYQKEVVKDPEELDYHLNNLNDMERKEKQKDTQISNVVRDLLLSQQKQETTIKNQLFENAKERNALERAIKDLDAQNKELERNASEQIEQLQRQNQDMDRQYKSLEENFKLAQQSSNSTSQMMANQLKKSRQDIHELEGRVTDLEGEKRGLESKLGEQIREIENLLALKQDLSGQNENLEHDLAKANDVIRKDREAFQNQLDTEKEKLKSEQSFANKQLVNTLSEKEKEISKLQIQLVNCEDELRKIRKRNIELQDQFEREQPLYRSNTNRSVIKNHSISPKPLDNQEIDYRNFNAGNTLGSGDEHLSPSYVDTQPQTIQREKTEDLFSNQRPLDSTFYQYMDGLHSNFEDAGPQKNHRNSRDYASQPTYASNTNLYKVNNTEHAVMAPDDGSAQSSNNQIKSVKSIQQWLDYWKYYVDNTTARHELLVKLSQSEKLKEEFVSVGEPQQRVLRQALETNNSDIYQIATVTMAELNDLQKFTRQQLNQVKQEASIVKCLRPKQVEETDTQYHILILSVFKILSHYNNLGKDWTQEMTNEIVKNKGINIISNYINQNNKEWQKLMALNFLHLIAKSKLMNTQIIESQIIEDILTVVDEVQNAEIMIAMLTVLAALFQQDYCIQTIKEPNLLLKIIRLYFHENNSVVSYCFDISYSVIPIFNFHQSLMKKEIFTRINQIAYSTAYPLCRSNAMDLLKQMIDNADPVEAEGINQNCYQCVYQNIEIPEKETLKEMTTQRDVIYQSLKVLQVLVENFNCPEEQRLCSKLMRVFSNQNLKNDMKIEKLVLEIIHIIWDKIEPVLLNHLNDNDVLLAVVDGYIHSEAAVENLNYGLMLIGVCEKESFCSFILENRHEQLFQKVIMSAMSEDQKVCLTAAKILYFLIQNAQSLTYIDEKFIQKFINIFNRENMDEEFVNVMLQSLFTMLKQVKLMQYLVDKNVIDCLFKILDESQYSSLTMIKCFSCLEMIHNLYRERNLLRELCVENVETSSDIIIGVSSVCLLKCQKEMGLSSLFFWRFLNKESPYPQLANSLYRNRTEEAIMSLVSLQRDYRTLVPEISSQISQLLANVSNQNNVLRDIVYEKDNS